MTYHVIPFKLSENRQKSISGNRSVAVLEYM